VTDSDVDSPATGWNVFADTTNRTRSGESVADVASTTRRDFLIMAGMGAAGATLVRPSALFAAVGAVKPDKILVPAAGHAAMQSAAKILAKKLQLGESAIQTYDGAPKATAGAIVLALAKDGKLAAAEMPKLDGYTVTYTGGTVGGTRPRSVLYAAGEPHHWVGKAAVYRRNPEFALRNCTWHPDYPVAEHR
jgi:hypothetical protein